MPAAIRVADPTDHGAATTGSPNTFVNGLPAVRATDTHLCSHGPGMVVPGSASVFVNGLPAARVGDMAVCAVKGPVTLLLGSPNTVVGG